MKCFGNRTVRPFALVAGLAFSTGAVFAQSRLPESAASARGSIAGSMTAGAWAAAAVLLAMAFVLVGILCFRIARRATLRVENQKRGLIDSRLGEARSQLAEANERFREVEERYQDLFENCAGMIAVLNPDGRYLHVNTFWQNHLGHSEALYKGLLSFESAFPPEAQAAAAALFRRALRGEHIEHAQIKMAGADGASMDVEADLSCRGEAGRPLSVRCILRDVTQQNRRERQLAMQLAVSQIVGESTVPEEALPRVLQALGSSFGWNMANLWVLDDDRRSMHFHSSWSTSMEAFQRVRQENVELRFRRGQGLIGGIWGQGAARWVPDVRQEPNFHRRQAAAADGLVTAWGVPVRVGNEVIAVIEFLSVQEQFEDREIMATVETVCASLGQFLARSAQESRVRELNRQKEFILNSVADGILGADANGLVVFANPAAARMLGAEESDLIGHPVHAVLHPAHTPVHAGEPERRQSVWERGVFEEEYGEGESAYGGVEREKVCTADCKALLACSTHQASSGQEVFYRADGSSFPVDFAVTPMSDAQGDVQRSPIASGRWAHSGAGPTSMSTSKANADAGVLDGFRGSVLSFRDVSQRYALDRLKDEFVSTVSHELRTPLTSIRGALGLLASGLMGDLNSKASTLLRIALSNSERLVRLINDILDLERMQSGRASLSLRRCALREILHQSVESIRPMADSAQVEFTLDVESAWVEADPDRLLQVATNLLSNAIKFSPPGSRINIQLRSTLGGVQLSVVDEGRGVPADKLESIFDRFQQVDSSDSRERGGTGLGLAICRTIVQQLGGRIWAERNVDSADNRDRRDVPGDGAAKGTTFHVFLPYRADSTAEGALGTLGSLESLESLDSLKSLECLNPEQPEDMLAGVLPAVFAHMVPEDSAMAELPVEEATPGHA